MQNYSAIINNIFKDILGGQQVDDNVMPSSGQTIYSDATGTAIHAIGSKSYLSSLKVYGTKYDASNLNFNHNSKAIITRAISTDVTQVKLGNNGHSGFLFAEANHGSYKVTNNQLGTNNLLPPNNEIDGVVQGISKYGNEKSSSNSLGFDVTNNTIYVKMGLVNLFGPNYAANGITTHYSSSYIGANNGKSNISNNIINVPNSDYQSGVGINTSFSKSGTTMASNTINFIGLLVPNGEIPQWSANLGIQVQNSDKFNIRNNAINGDPQALSTGRAHGIYMSRNTNYSMDCNAINNTQFGLTAIGANPSGKYNKINENTFNTTRAGLLMRHLAVDGWVGNIGEYLLGAPFTKYDANNHFNNINSNGATNKKVWRITVPNCNASAGDIITTQAANLTQAESIVTGGTAGCKVVVFNHPPTAFTQIAACNPPPPVLPPDHDLEYDRLIAQDLINYYNYVEGARLLDMEALLSILEQDATLRASDAILSNYYNNVQNTDLARLYQIDKNMSILYDLDPLQYPIQWQAKYEEVSNLNNSLEADNVIVENQRWINNILLYLANHNLEDMESTTIEEVKTLASQCPYIAGDAVFKARNILAPYEANIRYDDLTICNNQGVYKGGVNEFDLENKSLFGESSPHALEGNLVKVYPNPNNGLLKIDYKTKEDGQLNLYDISGRCIRVILLPRNTQHIVADISELARGIYTYSISINNIVINNGKLLKD
jgi:hypothetical protein